MRMTNSNDNDNLNDNDTFEGWPTEFKIKRECTPEAPCGRLTCAACSDPQRLQWIQQTLAITKAHPGQHEIATIVLPELPFDLRCGEDTGNLPGRLAASRFRGSAPSRWGSTSFGRGPFALGRAPLALGFC